MKLALVGGVFDKQGGRRSGYVTRLSHALQSRYGDLTLYSNGGHYDDLAALVPNLGAVDAVLWFADVPNDLPKLVHDIKARWPKILLVTSKRNLDNAYPLSEIIGRALKVKANLTVEMTGTRDHIESTIYDPLGSAFCSKEVDIDQVGEVLFDRLARLRAFKRMGSQQVGERIRVIPSQELDAFFNIVREQAERFHAIIHGVGHERMMGNASFRCAKGFPSFRDAGAGLLYVSQRDVDKRYIGPDAFVAVEPLASEADPVRYYGPVKPSVDTPIQVRIYAAYANVRFMLHSHTYIEGAPFTSEPIPCGAIEEAEEILRVVPDRDRTDFAINLRGHGSIVLASKLETLRGQPWCARPIPELVP